MGSIDEPADPLSEILRIVPEKQVPAALDDLEFRARDTAGQRHRVRDRDQRIVIATDDQGLVRNPMEERPAGPTR